MTEKFFEHDGRKIAFRQSMYTHTDSLALLATDFTKEPFLEPYAMFTKCIREVEAPETDAFLDTNNLPWALDFLCEIGAVEEVIGFANSGHCTYPLVRFRKDFLDDVPDAAIVGWP